MNASYTVGKNRFSKEYLTLNDNSGISGFTNDSVYGTKRFNIHWETDCFTPWAFYDFHFVLFLFADHSWLNYNAKPFFSNFPYTAIGFGIRIRNMRMVFNTIQIGFSFYPYIPPGSKTRILDISGETLFNPPNFLPQAPTIVPYK